MGGDSVIVRASAVERNVSGWFDLRVDTKRRTRLPARQPPGSSRPDWGGRAVYRHDPFPDRFRAQPARCASRLALPSLGREDRPAQGFQGRSDAPTALIEALDASPPWAPTMPLSQSGRFASAPNHRYHILRRYFQWTRWPGGGNGAWPLCAEAASPRHALILAWRPSTTAGRGLLGLPSPAGTGAALAYVDWIPRAALATEPYGRVVVWLVAVALGKGRTLVATTAGGNDPARPAFNHANRRCGPIALALGAALDLPPGVDGWRAGCARWRYPTTFWRELPGGECALAERCPHAWIVGELLALRPPLVCARAAVRRHDDTTRWPGAILGLGRRQARCRSAAAAGRCPSPPNQPP